MTAQKTNLENFLETTDLDGLMQVDGDECVIWDEKVLGLGLRLRSSSKPTWIVQRKIDGRSIKRTLGRVDALGLDDARAAAKRPIDLPVATKPPSKIPTVAAFVPVFLDDCAGQWKPSTWQHHRSNLLTHVVPNLGALPIDAVTRADVVSWFDRVGCLTASGNRALSVLSLMMQHAEALGLRPEGSNPCVGLTRRRSEFVARYLSGDEFLRLNAALARLSLSDPVEVAVLRFLMLTGARRGEALALEWSFIEGPRAVLPDSKTGPKTIWLALPVRRLLAGLARSPKSPFVFTRPDGRIVASGLKRVWGHARTMASLEGVRLHNLRHSYASVAVSIGEELRTVSSLLGHTDLASTMGYAHLADALMR